MKRAAAFFVLFLSATFVDAGVLRAAVVKGEYKIGIDDILEIAILQPDPLAVTLTVSPDGTITFPYIGSVPVEGFTLSQVQRKIQAGLAQYMQYPVVALSLKESRSRMFYVYGEVVKPGAFALQERLTVIRAISLAGGFTKYGSTSKVKILRQRSDGSGNQVIKVDVRAAMAGDSSQDFPIRAGDVITVEEGTF